MVLKMQNKSIGIIFCNSLLICSNNLKKLNILFKLLKNDQSVRAVIAHEKYSDFWLSILEQLPVKDLENFKFKTPEHLTTFEFVYGYLYYMIDHENINYMVDLEELSQLLKASCKYHSYHALGETICQITTVLFHDLQKRNFEFIKNIATILRDEAPHHGAIGFSLLANFLSDAAVMLYTKACKEHGNFDQIPTETREELLFCFMHSNKYMYIARWLRSTSINDIYNAYCGNNINLLTIHEHYIAGFKKYFNIHDMYMDETLSEIQLQARYELQSIKYQMMSSKSPMNKYHLFHHSCVNLQQLTPHSNEQKQHRSLSL